MLKDIRIRRGSPLPSYCFRLAAMFVIAITAAMESIPESYKKLLKPGGRLFVVIGEAPAMTAQLVTRTGEKSWTVEDLFETSIEPMIQPVKQKFEF